MGAKRKTGMDPEIMNEIQQKIINEHRDEPHPPIQKGALKAHLLVHGMVEKQIIENDPPQAAHAIERLTKAGMSRHEAIHAVGKIITKEAADMMKEGRDMNMQAYIKALENLGAEDDN